MNEKNKKDTPITGLLKKLGSFLSSIKFSAVVCWKAEKRYFIFRIILETAIAFQPVLMAFLGKEIINLLVHSLQNNEYQANMINFIKLIGIMLIIQLVASAIQKFIELLSSMHTSYISNFLNCEILRKSASLDISYFDSPNFYNELCNARRDSQAIQTISLFFINVLRSVIQLISAAIILINLDFLFPFILIFLSIPVILVEKYFTRKIYMWSRNRASEERKMAYLQDIMANQNFAKDLRLYNLFDHFFTRYMQIWKKWINEKNNLNFKRIKWGFSLSVLPLIGTVLLTAFIGIKIIYRQLTLGDYGLYTGMALQVLGSINNLLNYITQIYDIDMKIVNFKKFLAWKPIIIQSGTLKPGTNPVIEFRNVSFKYPGTGRLILKDLNFKIEFGQKIALVGLNGAGKTTLVKLLLRFYEPTSGLILLNGIDIREYDLNEVKKLFGVIFQDFVNYAFTLRESISLSDIERINNENEIMDACKVSGVDKVMARFKNGLDTYILRIFEENGEALSGGEFQKIALARAFFRKSSFMILDEPTSSLDPEAEHNIYEQFALLAENKSTILISHRLSSVSMIDKIFLLENGSIIESGSHEELMSKGEKFAYLFNLQASKYIRKTFTGTAP